VDESESQLTTETIAVQGPDTEAADAAATDAAAEATGTADTPKKRHRHAGGLPAGARLAAMARDTPPGLSRAWRWILRIVLVFQVLLIVVVGTTTVLRFHYFSVIDEEAHYSYVQQIAEHGSLPVLGKTETSLQALAIAQGIYPRHTTIDPKTDGIGGQNYEAFQPPLYYITAVPAFFSVGNYHDKIYALRFYGLLLLLVSVALAARLARVVLRERWMIGWAMTLVLFALPGVVVRFTTIGDLALAVPMALLCATELWLAWQRHSTLRYVTAGVTAALAMLSQLELVIFLPVFALVLLAEVLHRRSFVAWRSLILVALVPVVLVLPWLAFNEANYHMLTAGTLAIQEQTPIINAHHLHFSIGQLPNDTVNSIVDPVLPAEWGTSLYGQPALAFLEQGLAMLLVPGSILLILSLGRRLFTIPSAILGLPYVLIVLEMWDIRYGQQWMIFARYTYPALPMLLILAAIATETFRAQFLPVMVTIAATASLVALWVFYMFTLTGTYALH